MKPIIILEMANNHSGDLEHGLNIIRAYAETCKPYNDVYEFIFKFQYRNLDTFIRPDMAGDTSVPLIKRFSETRLSASDFLQLLDECKRFSFGTMVTPFDEASVNLCVDHNVGYIKVASCSFGDWPLLEVISKAGKPVVASCAGASEALIDSVVGYFVNRSVYLILQHCIGSYPTKPENMNVGQITYLKQRYPDIVVGFSSHEEPYRTDIAPLAYALGARSFEKHVALETESRTKNQYSTSPSEFQAWLESLSLAESIIGTTAERYTPSADELNSLRRLQRGVFLRNDVQSGQVLCQDDFYYAFPPSEGQVTANDISKYSLITATSDFKQDTELLYSHVEVVNHRSLIQSIARRVSELVREARVTFPDFADLEISHHYGVERFDQYGLTMITVINREYCKKILILLPGQSHPEQYHKQKEETFHVLWGSGTIRLDGLSHAMKPGDVYVIKPGTKHFFSSEAGIVIEEISSTHFTDDSFYTDPTIQQNLNRKTFLTHWRML